MKVQWNAVTAPSQIATFTLHHNSVIRSAEMYREDESHLSEANEIMYPVENSNDSTPSAHPLSLQSPPAHRVSHSCGAQGSLQAAACFSLNVARFSADLSINQAK
jgi:hypothetical protein